MQSDDFTMRREGEAAVLAGVGQGQAIGLCEAGAKAMAEQGSNFRHILAHYYSKHGVRTFGTKDATSIPQVPRGAGTLALSNPGTLRGR